MTPLRCWSSVKIGDVSQMWGCKAVLHWTGGKWKWIVSNEPAQDGVICPTCSHLLEAAQRKARIRIEKGSKHRIARGFGKGDPEHAFD